MKKAFITGIRGFTGKYLADELRGRGYEVYGISHGPGAPEEGVFQCELLDRERLSEVVERIKPDYVAHLAAISFVAHGNAEDIYRTNVVGSRNLLEALAKASRTPESVLLASSANIYGNATVDPIDESVSPNPANDYAVSKLAMEHMARLWYERLPITIVRPFNYTGVGQSLNFLPAKIVDHFRRGAESIELGNIEVERDFSDVRSVVSAYRRLLEAAPAGEVFNVCSGRAYRLRELLEMLEEIAGYQIDVRVNPAFIRDNEVKRLRGSNEKLRNAVGYEDALAVKDTLLWMYNQGN